MGYVFITFNFIAAGISVTPSLQNELVCSSSHNRQDIYFSCTELILVPQATGFSSVLLKNCWTGNNTVFNLPAHLGNIF